MKFLLAIFILSQLKWDRTIIGTENYGILLAKSGSDELQIAQGNLPLRKGSSVNFERVEYIATYDGKTIYAVSDGWLLKSENGGSKWRKIYKLPKGAIYSPNDDSIIYINRPITSLSVYKSKFVAFTTPYAVYISKNGGKSFQKLPKNPLTYSDYYTYALYDGTTTLVGTSYNGLFKYQNGKWKRIKGVITYPYNEGSFFYEEVKGVIKTGKRWFIVHNFGREISVFESGTTATSYKNHDFFQGKLIKSVSFADGKFYFTIPDGLYEFNPETMSVEKINVEVNLPRFIKPTVMVLISRSGKPVVFLKRKLYGKRVFPVDEKVRFKRAMYLGIPSKNIRKYRKIISRMKKLGFNAVVIDFKDDFGNLRYPSRIKMARESGAVKPTGNIKKIIKMFHDSGIYVIARLVSFKDKKMFFYSSNRFTIKDKETGKPWRGLEKEFWVDPYCREYHHYLLNVAKEIQNLGVDEIQFDYIRFPTDGPIWRAKFSYKPTSLMKKADAIYSFLLLVKKHLKIPVSIDVYGFNGWYDMGTRMGQDTTRFADLVDVVCPMLYPSHFGKKFLMKGDRVKRAYSIVYEGTHRLKQKLPKNEVRAYIQAFRWGSPAYGEDYVVAELEAVKDARAMSFTFWNPAGKYEKLFKWIELNTNRIWWFKQNLP